MIRTLTDKEIANCVKTIRKNRGWSQEQLAENSRLNLRTIQRVENGDPSSIDTRRCLADAFGANDIDAFNKATDIPSQEEQKKHQDYIENSCEQLDATKVTTGARVLDIAQRCSLSFFDSSFDMNNEVELIMVSIKNHFSEYGDCHDLYSYDDKENVANEIQEKIEKLEKLGVSLVYAIKETTIKKFSIKVSMKAAYIIAFPIGKEPEKLIIPNEADINE